MPFIARDVTELSDKEFRLLYERQRRRRNAVIHDLSGVLFSSEISDADKLQYAAGCIAKYYATLVQ